MTLVIYTGGAVQSGEEGDNIFRVECNGHRKVKLIKLEGFEQAHGTIGKIGRRKVPRPNFGP